MSSTLDINYESSPVAEMAHEGRDYRLDAGKQGTAICISSRESGSWDWAFVCEARWDGSELRAKSLERPIRLQLSKALASAMQDA